MGSMHSAGIRPGRAVYAVLSILEGLYKVPASETMLHTYTDHNYEAVRTIQ